MTSQGAEDKITNACGQERKNLMLRQSESTKGVLKKFANFAGKQLCQSLFFNKAANLRPVTLLKKRL